MWGRNKSFRTFVASFKVISCIKSCIYSVKHLHWSSWNISHNVSEITKKKTWHIPRWCTCYYFLPQQILCSKNVSTVTKWMWRGSQARVNLSAWTVSHADKFGDVVMSSCTRIVGRWIGDAAYVNTWTYWWFVDLFIILCAKSVTRHMMEWLVFVLGLI